MSTPPLTLRLLTLSAVSMIVLGVGSCPDESDSWDSSGGATDDFDGVEGGDGSDSGNDAAGGEGTAAELSAMAGDCAPVRWVSCGDRVEGDTSDPNSGYTTAIDGYPVSVGNYEGPEIAFAFRANLTEQVEWSLVDPEPTVVNHDLFVLDAGAGDGTCMAESAVKRGFNSVTFDVEAGQSYFLVLDGYDGDVGAFEFVLECDGAPGPEGSIDPNPAGFAEVIFSPQPYADSHLARTEELIDDAQATLEVAMYSFWDNRLMDALGRATNRGVSIRMLFQKTSEDRNNPEGSRSAALEDLGIEVRWVNKIMHHKFVLVDGPRDDESAAATAVLATGSGNWSYSAGTRYDENMVVVQGDERLVLQFQDEFNLLWDNSRDFVWNEDIPHVASTPVAAATLSSAEGSEAVFTSDNFETFVSSSYGPTFRTVSGRGAAREALADFIGSATESLWIASGHMRSRQVYDAIVHAVDERPDLDVRIYLDGQEYVGTTTHDSEVADFQDCMTTAATDTQRQNCIDDGLHFGWDLHHMGIPLRFKHYSYRWHYSYAVQMHHKYIVVDGERVASGSYNFSNNAEKDTFENVVFYEGTRYPELVAEFVANFDTIWETGLGGGLYDDLIDEVVNGTGPVPIVYDSMALDWDQLLALKTAIRTHCPAVNSADYRSDPANHMVCDR